MMIKTCYSKLEIKRLKKGEMAIGFRRYGMRVQGWNDTRLVVCLLKICIVSIDASPTSCPAKEARQPHLAKKLSMDIPGGE